MTFAKAFIYWQQKHEMGQGLQKLYYALTYTNIMLVIGRDHSLGVLLAIILFMEVIWSKRNYSNRLVKIFSSTLFVYAAYSFSGNNPQIADFCFNCGGIFMDGLHPLSPIVVVLKMTYTIYLTVMVFSVLDYINNGELLRNTRVFMQSLQAHKAVVLIGLIKPCFDNFHKFDFAMVVADFLVHDCSFVLGCAFVNYYL